MKFENNLLIRQSNLSTVSSGMGDMEKAKRSQNWSESERLAAVELIVDRYDQLFGKFRGATMGAKEKDRKWEEIATALNSSGQTNSLRTVLEIKKMFNNQKTRAKEKQDLCNRTGGGPKPVMTTIEELIIQHMMRTSKPIMEGIEGACESLRSDT